MIKKRLDKDIPVLDIGNTCGSCGNKIENDSRKYIMFGNMCWDCDNSCAEIAWATVQIRRAKNPQEKYSLEIYKQKHIDFLRQYNDINVEQLLYDIGRFAKTQSDQRLR